MVSRSLLYVLLAATSLAFACHERRAVNQAAQNRADDDATCIRKTDVRLVVAAIGDNVNAMEAELKAGADVNARVEGLGPALVIATLNGNYPAVKLLLDNGASVNATNGDGSTALVTAAMLDYRQIAQLLVSRGADVNAVASVKAKNGGVGKLTPLMVAKTRGHNEMAQLLIEAGAKE